MNPNNFDWQKLEERPTAIVTPHRPEVNNLDHSALFVDNREQEETKNSSRRSYELVIAIIIFYTFLGFIGWQQTDQRISMLENEISSLQSQLQTISPPHVNETFTESKLPATDNTLRFREVKRQWYTLARAIEIHKTVSNGNDPEWRLHKSYVDQQSMRQKLTINAVLIPPPNQLDLTFYQDAPSSLSFNTQYQIANLLIEFIFTQYGDETIPLMLDAFTEHENWETLAPAVFNMAAPKFETAWHEYLAQTYSQTTTDSEK